MVWGRKLADLLFGQGRVRFCGDALFGDVLLLLLQQNIFADTTEW